MDVHLAVAGYAQGLFPMDDLDSQDGPLPFYVADPRAVFELDDVDGVRRRVRRSLARDPGWELVVDRDFAAVLAACMAPRPDSPGVWITERLGRLYRDLHEAGVAHSFELREGDELLAGVLGVVLARAAMLESMFHRVPHAGNVALVRTLELLAERGTTLCDIQLITDHTRRLGAVEIPREQYEERLREALDPTPKRH
jgi:leucyl/phenylalanyl-tRNA--protein transferase